MSEPSTLEVCLPLPLNESELLEVIAKAKDWAIMHGAAMRSKSNFSADSLNFAPFVLLPSSFPRKEFEKAVALQPILNRLMHHVAHDAEFISKTLEETTKVDTFTANLFAIYKKILDNGFGQRISLGLLRSDIMLESQCPGKEEEKEGCVGSQVEGAAKIKLCTYCCWKQVEINTIASGFGHLGPASSGIQRFVLRELGYGEKVKQLPENNALAGLCGGMVKAWELYGSATAVILFVVEEVPYNICDQRFHEFYIRETYPHIKVLRKTLTEINNQAKLGADNRLQVGAHEVAVIYFRAGYEPSHYPTQNEWDARYLMEQSLAIKCPSIQYHLAGTKKVQQALAEPGVLTRFITDPNEIKALGKIFTGLYALDNNEIGNAAYEMALRTPERFVLKPQREGGGNNVYGLDIPTALERMTPLERSAWILMDRIHPPVSKGYMVRPGVELPPPIVDMISELGIFGVIIGDAENIVCNYQAGHMLRTKVATANEGGVAAGLGALDSPYLVEE